MTVIQTWPTLILVQLSSSGIAVSSLLRSRGVHIISNPVNEDYLAAVNTKLNHITYGSTLGQQRLDY